MPKDLRRSGSQRTPPAAGPAYPPSSNRTASAWTADEDEMLKTARAQGLNWQPIAQKYFPSKSPNACRKRHERLMDRKHAEDWEGEKLEGLAVAYMEVRQEMWSILASKVDEKWQIIEEKVSRRPLHCKPYWYCYRIFLLKLYIYFFFCC